MITKLVFLYIFPSFIFALIQAQDVNVKLPLGELVGSQRKNANGKTFYSFRGIPYAEPPTGDYRFQAARAKEPWQGTLDARKEKHYCYQMNVNNDQENEDCLFINVFTPTSPSLNSSLPVMFFIYGGGFIEGYATEGNYGPLHLMDYDVILVTFNYRVGPFGFFSLGDKVVPGNAGLKDQNLALKWTNKYIQYFGGDPKKITIFGHSAGSASVAYHLLSPKSNGLFRAAICESGSALSPWAFQRNLVELSYRLVITINPYEAGRKNTSTEELFEYLKTLSAKEIDEASEFFISTESYMNIQLQQGFFFTPTIEVEHEDAFLTQRMFDTFKNGEYNKVPIMIGVNSEESYFYVDFNGFSSYAISFDSNNKLLIPHDMNVEEENEDIVASTLKKFYVHSYGHFIYSPESLIKYFSDQSFARSIIKQAELQSNYGDVYFYQFSYLGVLGGHTNKSVKGFSDKVRHGEELSYVFSRNFPHHNTTDLSKYSEMDVTVLKRFITLFTNFAKYMNPTPENVDLLQEFTWPKVNTTFQYLDIGSSLEIKAKPKNDMYVMWENLYSKYGVPPFDTY